MMFKSYKKCIFVFSILGDFFRPKDIHILQSSRPEDIHILQDMHIFLLDS